MEKFEVAPKNVDTLEIGTIGSDAIDAAMREVFGDNYQDLDIELVEDDDWDYNEDVVYFD